MDEQLRKRLEEAADIYAKRIWNNLLEVHISKTDFLAGAELGYKEAIEVAKEWMNDNARNYVDGVLWAEHMMSDLETFMNELWGGLNMAKQSILWRESKQ